MDTKPKMVKRYAESELNQDNWNDELNSSDAGTFEKADKTSLADRKILSVRSNKSSKGWTPGLFKSFTGFSSYTNNLDSSFNLPSSCPNNSNNTTSTNNENEYLSELKALNKSLLNWITKQVEKDPQCILSPVFADYEKHIESFGRKFPGFAATICTTEPSKNNSEVFISTQSTTMSSSLVNGGKSLYTNVSQSFKFNSTNSNTMTSSSNTTSQFLKNINDNNSLQKPAFTFGQAPIISSAENPVSNLTIFESKTSLAPRPTFSFGSTPVIPNTSSVSLVESIPAKNDLLHKPLFRFGLPSTPTSNANIILSAPKFSFTAPNLNTSYNFSSQPIENDDNEEYIPPKPEVKEIKEEGSVYQIRCKLFYKLEDKWIEKGLGNLFIKPISDDKFQLLIRANTNLGNIILNVLINKDIPIKRKDNTLTFVCVPSPPLPNNCKGEEEPVLMLLRVKSEANASELLQQMNSHRGT